MSVGFALRTKKHILALAYAEDDYMWMKECVQWAGLDSVVKCGCEDALKLDSIEDNWDQVLLLDVLEHVKGDDLKVLQNVNRILRRGGYIIISVPTLLFIRYFGEETDKYAGHERHYTLDRLKELLASAGFKLVDWHYYPSAFTARLCTIWYKYCWRFAHVRLPLMPLLNALSIFDQLSPPRKEDKPLKSAGIALLAVKEKELRT